MQINHPFTIVLALLYVLIGFGVAFWVTLRHAQAGDILDFSLVDFVIVALLWPAVFWLAWPAIDERLWNWIRAKRKTT